MAHSIARFFADMPDPRRDQGKRHQLSRHDRHRLCAAIYAADSWADVVDFGEAKLKWFQTFLDLPHGIAWQDTFERVFARLDPDAFETCFEAWTRVLVGSSGGQLVAIDGKRVRRSSTHAWSSTTATHLVSVFVDANATALAQLAADAMENEIVAIPKLLQLLDLHQAVVAIDAMGCQTAIAREIIDGGGDYVLAVKDNQPTLHGKIEMEVNDMLCDGGVDMQRHQTIDGDHGRIESRELWAVEGLDWLGQQAAQWSGLDANWPTEPSVRNTTSLPPNAPDLAHCARGYFGIENSLHYVLNVSFAEDQARHRRGHGAQNFARLRRIALNLLRRDTSKKRGLKGKRLNAAWDHDYPLHLLTDGEYGCPACWPFGPGLPHDGG